MIGNADAIVNLMHLIYFKYEKELTSALFHFIEKVKEEQIQRQILEIYDGEVS